MAKKKQATVPPSAVKFIFVLLIVVAACILVSRGVKQFFWTCPYFKIKTIAVEDPNLQFIARDDLAKYRGRTIFGVNVQDIQRQLAVKYPQVASLKIVKNFPDQLSVVAKKRYPIFQLLTRNRILTLDVNGAVVDNQAKLDAGLTVLTGIRLPSSYIGIGAIIRDERMTTAVKILRLFRATPGLSSMKVLKINLDSLSGIEVYLSDEFKVIADKDTLDEKIPVLGVLFSQGRINMAQLNYIDLRFNDPVLGKRE